jgi:hypothetical protein
MKKIKASSGEEVVLTWYFPEMEKNITTVVFLVPGRTVTVAP